MTKEEAGMEIEESSSGETSNPILPVANAPSTPPAVSGVHPAVYVAVWIGLSSSVILFNKYILDTLNFKFPIFLTMWHLIFATGATQALARTTHLLDGTKKVPMTGRIYLRAIMPIGLFFSLSLICGNQAYLYLSVAFIQMLKATTPVAVLGATWAIGLGKPSLRVLGNVSIIVVGIMIASYHEAKFVVTGVVFQMVGIAFEATRLTLVERLLSSAEYKMDPLVSLYYFAPVCAVMNFMAFLVVEAHRFSLQAVFDIGPFLLLLNAMVAFGLNVSVVFLIGKTSSLVLTLCGVLKDILLVAASIIIWRTYVSPLQFFGYSIALAGLVYYRLGGEQLRNQYNNIRTESSLKWQEYGNKHPIKRKVFTAATIGGTLFLTVVMYQGYQGTYFSTTGVVQGVPQSSTVRSPQTNKEFVFAQKRKLDIVISHYNEDTVVLGQRIQALKAIPSLAGMNPRVIVYTKRGNPNIDQMEEQIGAAVVTKLPNVGREASSYLHHITTHYQDIAEHTFFAQADLHDFEHLTKRIGQFFVPQTGMLSLGFGYATCDCENCKDPWDSQDVWHGIDEVYSAIYGSVCPPRVLLSYKGTFIVSAKRIHSTPKDVYVNLKATLEGDAQHWIHKDEKPGSYADSLSDPYFGHTMERSWNILFQCSDAKLAETCKALDDNIRNSDLSACQCLDAMSAKF